METLSQEQQGWVISHSCMCCAAFLEITSAGQIHRSQVIGQGKIRQSTVISKLEWAGLDTMAH